MTRERQRLLLTPVEEAMLRMLSAGCEFKAIAETRGCTKSVVYQAFFMMRENNLGISTHQLAYELGRYDESRWSDEEFPL